MALLAHHIPMEYPGYEPCSDLANTTSRKARTSSENLTSRFCNHFSIIQNHYVCKMSSNYPGSKLEPARQR